MRSSSQVKNNNNDDSDSDNIDLGNYDELRTRISN